MKPGKTKMVVVVVLILLFLGVISIYYLGSQKKAELENYTGIIPGAVIINALRYNLASKTEIAQRCGITLEAEQEFINSEHNEEFSCLIENFAPEEVKQTCLEKEKDLISRASQNEFVLAFQSVGVNTGDFQCLSKLEPRDSESCESRGGKWTTTGSRLEPFCNPPTADGGKECSDNSDCEGGCIAELTPEEENRVIEGEILYRNGTCTSWEMTVGCHAFVTNGKVNSILCVG